jgi:periplasmic protein TonB
MASNSQSTGLVNRRLVAFCVLVAMHVVLLWGLANGLAHKAVQFLAAPIEVENIDEVKKDEHEPPPPPPHMDIPPPFVPAPDIVIDAPVETQAIVVTRQEAPPPPPPPPAVRTSPRMDPRRPFSRPEYPPTSRRLGEEGTVVLMLLVTEDGHVADAKIDKTSGFPRLDEAAVRESRRWRVISAKEGDKPVAAWGRFAITFRLTDEE